MPQFRRILATMRLRQLAVVALIAIAAIGVASLGSATLAATFLAPKGPVDPRVDPCALEGGICDPVAATAREATSVLTQAPQGAAIERTVVEAKARTLALTPLTPEAPATAVTYSALVSRTEYEAISHECRNYAVNLARPVWMVTVHAPTATSGSPAQAPKVVDVYSVALDAESGQWTDYCRGCAWLSASR
jgi:hypothetical protein